MGLNGDRHVIVTIHGIRTFGQWQLRLENLVHERDGDVVCIRYKFGYFSALAFLFPPVRGLIVRRFRKALRRVVKTYRPKRLDLVGHSFGTWVIAYALRRLRKDEDIRVHTVILAGSVLRTDFDWYGLIPHRVKRIVNDCGSKDNILILSQLFVLFTGMAGRAGFSGAIGGDVQENRFSEFGHSGYFQDIGNQGRDHYMKTHWLPLLLGDGPIPSFDDRQTRSAVGGFWAFLTKYMEPVKFTLWVLPVLLATAWLWSLKIQAELAEHRLNSVFDLAVALQSRRGGDASENAGDVLATVQRWASLPIRKTHILWVDDSSTNQHEKRSIGKFGICFDSVKDTDSAIALIERDPDRYGLIISDFRRDSDPKAGYGLLQELRQFDREIPVIFYVFSVPENLSQEELRRRGVSGEVSSPVQLFEMVFNTINPARESANPFHLVWDEVVYRCDQEPKDHQ